MGVYSACKKNLFGIPYFCHDIVPEVFLHLYCGSFGTGNLFSSIFFFHLLLLFFLFFFFYLFPIARNKFLFLCDA